MTLERVLVTGGAGFIGSALVRRLIRGTRASVLTVDKLTYAGHLSTLEDAFDDARHRFEQVDVCDGETLRALFTEFRPTSVLHLAAESHVDRSIDSAAEFVRTNVVGTGTLLEETRRHWKRLPAAEAADFRFLHVSTDEVYGSLEEGAFFTESSSYEPSSPYAASKAGADHLVRAWTRTYGLPCLVTNCSNNYGPYQFPEKLIPLMILNAGAGRRLPVYGRGENVRDWLHVEDHVEALLAVLDRGRPGETYLIGGGNPVRNIDVVERICDLVDGMSPENGTSRRSLIEHVADRPGHDERYAIDPTKVMRETGWAPRWSFEEGLRRTVAWYLEHTRWCEGVRARGYGGERLGLEGSK